MNIEHIHISEDAESATGSIMFKHKYSKFCDSCKRPKGDGTKLCNEIVAKNMVL